MIPVVRTLLPPPWPKIEPLIRESEREGFRFLARLRRDFEAGSTRFDRRGEVLLGVESGPDLVAVGGLTLDPYATEPRVGRLRHLYVSPTHRRRGVGRLLVAALVEAARPHFDVLTLRTDTQAAARFYQALGFAPAESEHHTHRLALRPASSPADVDSIPMGDP
jgi:GNAT superfamily N-acetyltransferase